MPCRLASSPHAACRSCRDGGCRLFLYRTQGFLLQMQMVREWQVSCCSIDFIFLIFNVKTVLGLVAGMPGFGRGYGWT